MQSKVSRGHCDAKCSPILKIYYQSNCAWIFFKMEINNLRLFKIYECNFKLIVFVCVRVHIAWQIKTPLGFCFVCFAVVPLSLAFFFFFFSLHRSNF